MLNGPKDAGELAGGSEHAQMHALREVVLEDVWSRTEPRYRRRAVVLLLVNAVVFAGLNVFGYWLQTFDLFDFSVDSYRRAIRIGQLTDFALGPIRIEQVPMMTVIVGLTMGIMVIVPILVAQLYRLQYSIIFVAELFLLAHLPLLALFELLGCCIAGSKLTRLQFKYASTLLGLLPMLIYFYLGTRPTDSSARWGLDSNDLLLLAPWGVAILSAAVIGGIMLMIAYAVRMRPGAIAPVLTVCFTIPVVLFHHQVGRDELRYRALYRTYGRYSPESGQRTITKGDLAEEFGFPLRYPSDVEKLRTFVEQMLPRIRLHAASKVIWRQNEAIAECNRFLKDFPNSPYVPNVLYLMGWANDLRANLNRLKDDLEVEFYHSFPSSRSRPYWQRLVTDYPDSNFTVLARLQLARLELREGRTAPALKHLKAVVARPIDDGAGSAASAAARSRVLSKRFPDRPLQGLLPELRRQAARLAYLVEQNRDDPVYGNKPLADLMRLDPWNRAYRRQLARLIATYPNAWLADDLLVLLARCQPDPKKQRDLLRRYAETFKGRDAGTEALFALANVLRRLANEDGDQKLIQQAHQCYQQLIQDAPDTPYAREARSLILLAQPGK